MTNDDWIALTAVFVFCTAFLRWSDWTAFVAAFVLCTTLAEWLIT